MKEEKKVESVDGLNDRLQNWATPINAYFKKHESEKNFMVVIGGALIDLVVVAQVIG